MLSAGSHGAKLGSKIVEAWFAVSGQRLAKNFAVFGFGRTPVASGAAFQSCDQVVIDVADIETAGHGERH